MAGRRGQGAGVILASRSPQRKAILEQLGVPFTITVPDVEERAEGDPRELVVENALRKIRAVPGDLVLGVDTTVALEGRIFGKPAEESAAEHSLGELSGRTHEVWSGIAVRRGGEESTTAARTSVRFRTIEPALMRWYLDSGEWRERAGGYAIQGRGAALVEAIEGDFWNVVGLPVPELLRLLPDLLG